MNKYYSTASYVQFYDDAEPPSLLRNLDLVQVTHKNALKDPSQYLYEYLSEGTGSYNLPAEAFNYQGAVNFFGDLLPGTTKDERLYYSNMLLPQFNSATDISPEIEGVGSILPVTKDGFVYNNIYFSSLPGEHRFQIFEASDSPTDPYSTLGTPKALSEVFIIDKPERLNFIVVGLNVTKGNWEYKTPILNEATALFENIFRGLGNDGDQTRLITKKELDSLNLESYISEELDGLKVHNRLIKSTPTTILKSADYDSGLPTYSDPF